MRQERQIELLARIANAGEGLHGLYGSSSMVSDAAMYVDPERFAAEQRVLFREGPVFLA